MLIRIARKKITVSVYIHGRGLGISQSSFNVLAIPQEALHTNIVAVVDCLPQKHSQAGLRP